MAEKRSKFQFGIFISCIVLIMMKQTKYMTMTLKHSSFKKIESEQNISPMRPTTFLLGIFCSWDNEKERRLFCNTMLGKHLPLSVVSRLCSLNDFLSDSTLKSSCQIIYTFVIGGNPSSEEYYDPNRQLVMDNPNASHELDLTILNIKENMNNGKTPSWFYFASKVMRDDIDYISKSDLDTFISIPYLFQFVNNSLPSRRQSNNPKIYGCIFYDSIGCGGPAYAQCRQMEKKFSMSGQFYFVSHDIVMMRHLWMKSYSSVPYEDVDFGLRIWQGNIPFNAVILNFAPLWVHLVKDETSFRSAFEDTRNKSWNLLIPQ